MARATILNVADHADALALELDVLDADRAVVRPPALNVPKVGQQLPDRICGGGQLGANANFHQMRSPGVMSAAVE